MLSACRTAGEGFAIPTFNIVPSDVEGFMEELWEVTIQVVKMGITLPLATADRLRAAKTAPLHPAGWLHRLR